LTCAGLGGRRDAFDQLQFLEEDPILRNKLLIALTLVCALGFGSSIANAQCGGSMSMGKHKHAKMRHARKHGRRHSKAKAATTTGNANNH
jgi:hypothetical protein